MDKAAHISEVLDQFGTLCPSGYAVALHVWFTTPRFLIQTYDPEWIALYSRRGYIMHDPTVRWGFENEGICHWTSLKDRDTHKVFDSARKYGLNHGVSMAITTLGSRTLAGFTRPDRPHSADEIDTLSALLQTLHDLTADPDALSDADTASLRKAAARTRLS